MHTAPYPKGLEPPLNDEKYLKFSLKMDAFPVNISFSKKHIYAHSDVSGSMSDMCKDRRTKIQHIIHIWTNIIHYIADHPELNISLQLRGFDNNIHNIFDLTKVTKDNADNLIEAIKQMRPQGSTDIQLALNDLSENIKDCTEQKYALLMTDGDITSGETDPYILADILPPETHFAAIAFGTKNNASLMQTLGQSGMNTSNWLVSDLEHSAEVYGEIFAKWLYQLLDNVVITVKNGFIYDWKTNEWTNVLSLGSLSAEENRSMHIKSTTPYEVIITLGGKSAVTGIPYTEEIDLMPELIDDLTWVINTTDLTKDIFRLRTQDLLYQAKQIKPNSKRRTRTNTNRMGFGRSQNVLSLYKEDPDSENNEEPELQNNGELLTRVALDHDHDDDDDDDDDMKEIKRKINNHKEVMEQYLKDNTDTNMKDDAFILNLIADMEMTYRKLGTINQLMYIAARCSSQGRQQTQCVIDTDEFIDAHSDRPDLMRAQTNSAYASPIVMDTIRNFSAPHQFSDEER